MSVQYRRRRGGRKQYRKGGKKFVRSGGLVKVRSALQPRRMLVKLNFEKTAQIVAGASFPAVNQFVRLNSIWDPDTDVAANQQSANGYSLYNLQYEKYRVYGVSYDIEVLNIQGISAAVVACMPSYGALSFSDVNEFNQYYARKATLGPVQGMNKCRWKGFWKLPMVKGQSQVQFKSDNTNVGFLGNTGTNPSEQCFLTIGSKAIDISQPVVLQFAIKVVYHIELFDPVQHILFHTHDDATGPTGPN